ncbi:hypothetical protein [Neopusillimonas aromaticivorans]|uniref:hypothetical protein n=1 Tax=Neopusillimonas aromaticivorans TaxID=2979868 RepID=UPI0025922E97|nr:hypothetical protein [Neopusillimonas aromaticivorans]WJJ93550.1 hypothetical protein N7E01_16835 [Neopusillimonas aromaticivorans]
MRCLDFWAVPCSGRAGCIGGQARCVIGWLQVVSARMRQISGFAEQPQCFQLVAADSVKTGGQRQNLDTKPKRFQSVAQCNGVVLSGQNQVGLEFDDAFQRTVVVRPGVLQPLGPVAWLQGETAATCSASACCARIQSVHRSSETMRFGTAMAASDGISDSWVACVCVSGRCTLAITDGADQTIMPDRPIAASRAPQ